MPMANRNRNYECRRPATVDWQAVCHAARAFVIFLDPRLGEKGATGLNRCCRCSIDE